MDVTDKAKYDPNNPAEPVHNLTHAEYLDLRRDGVPKLTLREALIEIQKVIARTANIGDLAMVLRALRGPDDDDSSVKFVSTVPIRCNALGYDVGSHFGACHEEGFDVEAVMGHPLWHFRTAIEAAAILLEMADATDNFRT